MKKSKFFMFILIISALIFSCISVNNMKINVFAEDQFTSVNSLSEITNESGKYSLNREKVYEYSSSLVNNFSGEINGNGAIIRFNGLSSFVPLFNRVESGAKIYNLKFSFSNLTSLTTDVSTTKTSYGVLADIINNSTIYGIEFNNIEIILKDNNLELSATSINFGFLAGQINGGSINQIKINNCKVSKFLDQTADDETYVGLRPNVNLGLIAGKLADGTLLQNNLITNNSVNVIIAESLSTNYNFGGLVGLIESGFITNNIINFTNEDVYNIELDRVNKYLNFGFLTGKSETKDVSFINNVIIVEDTSILEQNEDNMNLGLLIGFMQNLISNSDINGLLSTNINQYVGNMSNETFLNNYSNINIDNSTVICTDIEKRYDMWQGIYSWNFSNIWRTINFDVPTLQIFEDYAISFSSLESVKSLGIENLPALANNEDVVINNLSSNIVPYGDTVTITTSITNKNNYDKYFYITGLNLNGEQIYSIETQKSTEGYYISSTENNGKVIFSVKNFIAGNSGVYSVQLARKTYKLKINVYELTVNDQPFIPGKIKNNMASEGNKELEVDMQYGVLYTYETYEVNSDYAQSADWYLTYSSTEEPDDFNLETATTSFNSKRSLSWTFNENCILFGNNSEDKKGYFDISEYSDSNIFSMYVVFTRDVKDIEVRFKFDNDEQILDKIAEVLIDGEKLTFKNGVFTTKISYGTKQHIIKITGLSTEYSFDGWYINSRLTGVAGDEYAGSFEVINDGDSETIVIYAVFTNSNTKTAGSLLWLWITLGGLGVAAIVVVIIIVVKKKSGDKSYRKYMY